MERLFLLETVTPARSEYNRETSLQAMRIMRQTIENRLRAPAQYGAAGATTGMEIIAVGNQFAGFGAYPDLDADLAARLSEILTLASNVNDRRHERFALFVLDAVTAATEAAPQAGQFAGAPAWRTHGSGSPGTRFRLLATLQGNDFYATNPVPPLPKHHRVPGK